MRPLTALLLLTAWAGETSAAFPTLTLKPVVAKQLVSPVSVAHAGDGSKRLFICEQGGQIRIFQHGMLLPGPFLDLGTKVLDLSASQNADERGLLGLAFHPQYGQPGQPGHRRFYVYYSRTFVAGSDPVPAGWTIQPNHMSVLAEYQVSTTNPNAADPTTERVLLSFAQPQSNHNGGQLEFGPDGWLYLSTGDGGSSNDDNNGHTGGNSSRPADALGNSQDLSNLLGKILRLDPLGDDGPGGQYGIPPDNPFVDTSGVRGEIYAFGLRNPWRFSFDNFGTGATHRLFCADVGQGKVEEINLIKAGGNYGWRRWEGGFDLFPNAPNPSDIPPTAPVAAYAHPGQGTATGLPEFGISITGGHVYRGTAIPALQGKYVFADYSTAAAQPNGILLGLEETSPGVFGPVTALSLSGGNPLGTRVLALGRDEDGELYVATKVARGAVALGQDGLPSGALWKLIPATQELILTAARDTSLFEENNHSNARGATFFTGKIGYPSNGETPPGALRRALLAFDLSAVPSGLTLQSATVSLHLDAAGSPGMPFEVRLHKVTQAWAEGTSQASLTGGTGASPTANDATWNHRAYSNTLWTTPGGDFVATASAGTTVANAGQTHLWQSAGLLADVQAWLASPATNHGWMVRGDEIEYYSAMRFFTREWTTPAQRPRLHLTYVASSAPTRREAWLTEHYPDEPVGFYLDPAADEDGDGLASEFEYALNLNPRAVDEVDLLSIEVRPGDEGGTDHVFHFPRDAGATDLDLLLEFRQATGEWQVLARSVAGAAMTAENGAEVITDEAVNGDQYAVSVRLHAPDESPLQRGFGRLRLERRPQ
jgi:glucose/arabinose dehydrogenase